MQKPIVVVGSLNLDLVARVDRLPSVGETITGADFHTYGGGKGANQAVALGRLGAQVKMIGKLGSDTFAVQLRKGLETAGVDTGCVDNVEGSSGTALITTSARGENTIVVIPGANAALTPADIDKYRGEIEGAAMVLGQLEIPHETTKYLGTVTHAAGVPLLLDPAPARALPAELLQCVTWFTPNESETRTLAGAEFGDVDAGTLSANADRLLRLGVRNVVLKLGSRGVYLAGRDVERTHVEAFQVEAVDSTAAGDAFNGAFAFALMVRGMSPAEAAEFACAAAAISVTRAGAQTSMPTLPETEAFLAERRAVRS